MAIRNDSKCKITGMHFGKNQVPRHYFMKSQQQEEVEEENDLGIIITQDLTVSLQCQLAYGKTSWILRLINRAIKYSPDVLIRLYKSLVRPHLEYGNAAWSLHYTRE